MNSIILFQLPGWRINNSFVTNLNSEEISNYLREMCWNKRRRGKKVCDVVMFNDGKERNGDFYAFWQRGILTLRLTLFFMNSLNLLIMFLKIKKVWVYQVLQLLLPVVTWGLLTYLYIWGCRKPYSVSIYLTSLLSRGQN